ncbi:MAG: histidinol-phosphate transaminase [Gammaproteobacteria bacterium]|nr:histidinol-phosphate transaminase [Gammaproteobacteria bacterium]
MNGKQNTKLHLAAPGVQKLKPYNPGKPILELEREYGVRAAIKLASNENPLGPGELAKEAIQAAIGDIARYPDGNGFGLKQELAGKLKVGVEQITLGNGSNDVLELVARAFVTDADEVVYSQHAFAVYSLVTQAVGARAVVTPATDWGHDLKVMAKSITKQTRLVFIANPNNPTGTWLKSGALKKFIKSLPEHVLVVVDQAYAEYIDLPEYPNCIPWVEDFPNLIVTRTFSKAHGLAGLRVGYSISHPDTADLLNRVRQPFNVNHIALAVARAALDDQEHLQRSVQVNRQGMRQLTEAFQRLELDYIPSVGNFVCVGLGRPAAPVYDAMLREGVIVRPIENYGMPQHLRVTVGRERENRRFLTVLQKILIRSKGKGPVQE